MKRLLSILAFAFICLLTCAVPADTSKIRVACVENRLDIEAVSGKVYVRKGNSQDKTNYIFVTDTLLEIICNDTSNVSLKGGYQEDIVTCWSQVGTLKPKQDGDEWHNLAPQKRRNWLEFNSNHIKKQGVDLILMYTPVNSGKINVRNCGKWDIDKLCISYATSNGRGQNLSLVEAGESNVTITAQQPIALKSDDQLRALSLKREGLREVMIVEEVLFDGNAIPFKARSKDGKTFNEDDIMFAYEIIADTLLNRDLGGGHHTVSYKCIVLSKDGPNEIIINLPIDVEKNHYLTWCFIGLFLGLILIWQLWDYNKKSKDHDGSDEEPSHHKKRSVRSLINNLYKLLKKEKKSGQDDTITPTPSESDHQDNNLVLEAENSELGQKDKENSGLQPGLNSADEEEKINKAKEESQKKTINSVINKWNEKYPGNQVNSSQRTIDFLFTTIEKGYIGPDEKSCIEKAKNEYQSGDQSPITSINELINAVYNKGLIEGGDSAQKATLIDISDSAKQQLETIEELEQDKKDLISQCSDLETKNKELSDRISGLEKEKKQLTDRISGLDQTNSVLSKQVSELTLGNKNLQTERDNLKGQVSTQSQNNIDKLENKIEELNQEITQANETISGKESELKAKQKELEKLIIKKEELESKYNTVNEQLSGAEAKHREAINSLKEGHKAACLEMKESFKNQLLEKDKERTKAQKDHEFAMNEQRNEFNSKFAELKEENDKKIQTLTDEHNAAINRLNDENKAVVDQLNATINELSVRANVGRNETIAKADKLLRALSENLTKLNSSVNSIVVQPPIFVSIVRNILTDLKTTCEAFDYFKDGEWTNPDKTQAQVILDMQGIFINALGKSRWINNVTRLLSYSRLPALQDGTDLPSLLESHGISSALVECIYADLSSLLGIADIGLIVPAVLANNYSMDSYDYTNGDTWIDKFFPEVSIRNYKGKVFDIVQVGYAIGGKTIKKPDVQYN